MLVKVQDLDAMLKSVIIDKVRMSLIKEYKTIPSASDIDKIYSVVASIKDDLDKHVVDYYHAYFEHDVECSISELDYVKVYLRQV